MTRKILIALIATLLLCICLVVGGFGLLIQISPTARQAIADRFNNMPAATIAPIATSSTPRTPVSPPTLLPATPLPLISNTTADALARAQIPVRNLYQIVPRLKKNPALLTPVPTSAPRTRKVGDKETFFVVENASTGSYRPVTATLQAITPNAYFWVEDALKFDPAALKQSANFFEQKVYPTDVEYFGTVGVGLDGDTRIHILNTRFQDAAGYYSSEDTYPRQLVPFSNERNIIYMNIEAVPMGRNEYNGDLGHELQHLIHNRQAQYATGWIDEGMGDLAIKENGFPILGVLDVFSRDPNTQLDTWGSTPQSSGAHYAASYLFFDYAAQRFGPDFTKAVIHAPAEGINGVQAVLDQRANGMRFDDLFADWAIANYLNDPTVENGRYAYTNENTFRISRAPTLNQFPSARDVQMSEYTANYTALQPSTSDVTIYFTGTTTAKLLPVDAHSGKWVWYSNRADLGDTTLTRQFDLSSVAGKATLQFSTWFDIEKNFDYGYVEASTDGGKTWDILRGKYSSTENPNGANYGAGFTGRSGAATENSLAQWAQEQIDLSSYAGKTILVRFEYITDDALNLPSWAIDDISIPEINYADDVESGDGGWQALGFIRSDNVLPQKYIVQVIESGASTQVVRVSLDAQNRGSLTIHKFGIDVTKAVLVVTAHAPTTTEPTEFQFSVVPK